MKKMEDLTQNPVIRKICEEYQEEMDEKIACGEAEPGEFVWTQKAEILFFYAMMGYKPVGVNRHFMMLLIHNRFTSYVKREVPIQVLWNFLESLYDLNALNESEVIPFPNEELDFQIPQDWYELLERKHGVILQRSNRESEASSVSSSKSSKKPAPKSRQSSSSSTPRRSFASRMLSKSSKIQATVKNKPKAKHEVLGSCEITGLKFGSESSSETKEVPSSILLSPRSKEKLLEGNPYIVNKPIRMVPSGFIISGEPKKEIILYKPEKVKIERTDSSVKKISDEPVIKETEISMKENSEVYVKKYNNGFVRKYACSCGSKQCDGGVKKYADSSVKKYTDASVKKYPDVSVKKYSDGSVKKYADGSVKKENFVSGKKDSDISGKKDSDVSGKKDSDGGKRSDKDLANKKWKMSSSDETLSKQSKASGSTKTEADHGGIKIDKILQVKLRRIDEPVKSASPAQELEASSSGSSSPIVKVPATPTKSKKKSTMVEETPKKTSAPKRKR